MLYPSKTNWTEMQKGMSSPLAVHWVCAEIGSKGLKWKAFECEEAVELVAKLEIILGHSQEPTPSVF